MKVIGYMRVSTDDQATNGYGLDAQRSAIEAEAAHRGWPDVEFVEDAAASGRSLDRSGLRLALATLGPDDLLVVSRLDRLSRSTVDFGTLLARAKSAGWSLVALDFGMDTSTPNGELVANVLVSVAQWERRTIAERTKDGLAAARRRGVQLGRPSTLPDATRDMIARYRAGGLSLQAISDRLTDEGVPTASGSGRWAPQLVHRVVQRIEREARESAT